MKVKGSVFRWGLPITAHLPLHLEAADHIAPFPPSQVRPVSLGRPSRWQQVSGKTAQCLPLCPQYTFHHNILLLNPMIALHCL